MAAVPPVRPQSFVRLPSSHRGTGRVGVADAAAHRLPVWEAEEMFEMTLSAELTVDDLAAVVAWLMMALRRSDDR